MSTLRTVWRSYAFLIFFLSIMSSLVVLTSSHKSEQRRIRMWLALGLHRIFIFFRVKARKDIKDAVIRRLVRKRRAAHLLNFRDRQGYTQAPYIRVAETVEGHVGSCIALLRDFGWLLKLDRLERDRARDMLDVHETDEMRRGDRAHSTWEQKMGDFEVIPRDTYFEQRRKDYRASGRAEVIHNIGVKYDASYNPASGRFNDRDADYELALLDEYTEAVSKVATIVHEIDVLQPLFNLSAYFMWMVENTKRPERSKNIATGYTHFGIFLKQSREIIRNQVLIRCMDFLLEDMTTAYKKALGTSNTIL